MKYLLALILVVSAYGQNNQSNSIYATLFSATSTSPQSVSVQNIGQIGHNVKLVFSGCAGAVSWSGGLQYSFDNSTYYTFGTQYLASALTSAQFIESGLYPFVRFVISFSGTGCTGTANYTGTVGSVRGLMTGVNPLETTTSIISALAPVITGGIAGTAAPTTTPAVGQVVNNILCDTNIGITVPAGTTVRMAIGAPNSRIYVCGGSLLSDGAAGVNIIEGTGGTCGTATVTLGRWAGMIAGVPIPLIGNSPVIRTQVIGNSLCITGTGAGNISGMLSLAALPSISTW